MLSRGRTTESSILDLLGRVSARTPGRELFSEILDTLLEALGAERVFLFRFRPGGGFRVLAARNLDGENLSRPQERMSHHAIRKMAREEGLWVVEEARQDRRYRSEDVTGGARAPLSIVTLPLRIEGQIAGGIYADHRFQKLSSTVAESEEVRALSGLCALAVFLREQTTQRRLLEKKLESRQMRLELATEVEPQGGAASSSGGPLPLPERSQDFHGFVSGNPDLLDLFDTIRGLQESTIPILIRGETGVGKSLLARAVHLSSPRCDHPLVVVGCASIPETLIESELLGHVRGAFTGADRDREGLLAQAHGGTLVLDEVADLSRDMQAKLLRVLEDGKVRPVGGKDTIDVDVRVVTTTSRNLERLSSRDRFRKDLYFRLRGLELEISPLRERREDIPLLVHLFLEKYGGRGAPPSVTDEAMRILAADPWPGNVRELENEIRRLLALEPGDIDAEVLAPFIRRRRALAPGSARGGGTDLNLDQVVSVAEREAIVSALGRCAGNKSQAAELLGISRKALYRRLTKYGIPGIETQLPPREGP